MNKFHVLCLKVFIVAGIISFAAGYNYHNAHKNFLALDGSMYYAENSVANQTEALEFCKELGGELAKITSRTLSFRVYVYLLPGAYWIDGMTKGTGLQNFELNNECSDGKWDISAPPLSNKLNGESCLVFVKGGNLKSSGIRPQACGIKNRILCSMPDKGCRGRSTQIFVQSFPKTPTVLHNRRSVNTSYALTS